MASIAANGLELALVRMSAFESEIVRYAEYPSTQVSSRAPKAQMSKESKKDLLNNFFRIGNWHAERDCVPQERSPVLFEQDHDLCLYLTRACLSALGTGQERQIVRRLCRSCLFWSFHSYVRILLNRFSLYL